MEWGRLRFIPLSLFVTAGFTLLLFPFVLLPLFLYKKGVVAFARIFFGPIVPLTFFTDVWTTDAIYTKPACNAVFTAHLSGPKKIDLPEMWKRAMTILGGNKVVPGGDELPKGLDEDSILGPMPILQSGVSSMRERGEGRFEDCETTRVQTTTRLKGRPLWEVVLWSNWEDPAKGSSSAVTLRVHHSIGDIYALITLLQAVVDLNPGAEEELAILRDIINAHNGGIKKPWCTQILNLLDLAFLMPGELTVRWIRSLSAPVWEMEGQGVHTACNSNSLKAEELVRIAAKNGTHTSAILAAGVTVALRNCKCLKDDVYLGFALPRGNRPGRLTNHFDVIFFRTPSSVGDRDERIGRLAKELRKFQVTSSLSTGLLIATWTISLLSTVTRLNLTRIMLRVTAGLTVWPSVSEGLQVSFNGSKVVGVDFACGRQLNRVPVMFASGCYDGKVFLFLCADAGLFTKEEVDRMLDDVAQEVLACGTENSRDLNWYHV